jgi:hybrid cluster-associated redox disulfide protein
MPTIETITADSLVKEVVDCHPQTIPIFTKYGLKCVGCYIAPFHTITDTAREHALGIELLLSDLNQIIQSLHPKTFT